MIKVKSGEILGNGYWLVTWYSHRSRTPVHEATRYLRYLREGELPKSENYSAAE